MGSPAVVRWPFEASPTEEARGGQLRATVLGVYRMEPMRVELPRVVLLCYQSHSGSRLRSLG